MNYEKKYKNALAWARQVMNGETGFIRKEVEEVFPELKENEDDKMWKLLKKYAHCNISDLALEADHITREQLESWLEKQGKQKLVEWSEEDEKIYEKALDALYYFDDKDTFENKKILAELCDWIGNRAKTLRPQKQLESKYQNWTARDEEELKIATDILREAGQHDSAKWVENLATFPPRNQKQWKPSEEHIKAIRLARSFVTDDFGDNTTLSEILIGLEEQLKNLCSIERCEEDYELVKQLKAK